MHGVYKYLQLTYQGTEEKDDSENAKKSHHVAGLQNLRESLSSLLVL